MGKMRRHIATYSTSGTIFICFIGFLSCAEYRGDQKTRVANSASESNAPEAMVRKGDDRHTVLASEGAADTSTDALNEAGDATDTGNASSDGDGTPTEPSAPGQPAVESASLLLFSDNFNRANQKLGSPWKKTGLIVNNELPYDFLIENNQVKCESIQYGFMAIVIYADATVRDVAFEIKTILRSASLVARYDSAKEAYYRGGMRPVTMTKVFFIDYCTGLLPTCTTLASSPAGSIYDQPIGTLKFKVKGDTLTLFWNNKVKLTATDSRLTEGYIGFSPGSGSTADDFVATLLP